MTMSMSIALRETAVAFLDISLLSYYFMKIRYSISLVSHILIVFAG